MRLQQQQQASDGRSTGTNAHTNQRWYSEWQSKLFIIVFFFIEVFFPDTWTKLFECLHVGVKMQTSLSQSNQLLTWVDFWAIDCV